MSDPITNFWVGGQTAQYSESQNVVKSGGISAADKKLLNRAEYSEGDSISGFVERSRTAHDASKQSHDASANAAVSRLGNYSENHRMAAKSHQDAAHLHAIAAEHKDAGYQNSKSHNEFVKSHLKHAVNHREALSSGAGAE